MTSFHCCASMFSFYSAAADVDGALQVRTCAIKLMSCQPTADVVMRAEPSMLVAHIIGGSHNLAHMRSSAEEANIVRLGCR